MSANVIPLAIAPRPQPSGDFDEISLSGIRLPRRVYQRLLRLARERSIETRVTAELLLLDAINQAASAASDGAA